MNKNIPIFLRLSRNFQETKNGEFIFKDNNNSLICKTKEVYLIVDPAIDSTFKYLFAENNTNLLENFLNSLFFPNFPRLSDIVIINNEIVKFDQLRNKGTIRCDLACKAKYNNENVIIGIEIQIGKYRDFTYRLLK